MGSRKRVFKTVNLFIFITQAPKAKPFWLLLFESVTFTKYWPNLSIKGDAAIEEESNFGSQPYKTIFD